MPLLGPLGPRWDCEWSAKPAGRLLQAECQVQDDCAPAAAVALRGVVVCVARRNEDWEVGGEVGWS